MSASDDTAALVIDQENGTEEETSSLSNGMTDNQSNISSNYVDKDNGSVKSDSGVNKSVASLNPRKRKRLSTGSTRSSRSSSSEAQQELKIPKKEHPSSPSDQSSEEDFLGFDSPVDKSTYEEFSKFVDDALTAEPPQPPAPVPVKEKEENLSRSHETVHSTKSDSVPAPQTPTAAAAGSISAQFTPSSPQSTPNLRKALKKLQKKPVVDVTKPEFKKPFEQGWVREVVYRNATESVQTSAKRTADVYYYTPGGRKIRSLREIADHLTKGLTVENFTFAKEPIGMNDIRKEIVRDARPKPTPDYWADGSPLKKGAKPRPSRADASKVMVHKPTPLKESPKPSLKVAKKKIEKKRKSTAPEDGEMHMDWTPDQKTKITENNKMNDDVAEISEKRLKLKPLQSQDLMTTLNAGFIALLHSFQYLKVHELLRASCVSQLWNLIASHSSLWETVRMKNSRVRDWEGFGNALRKHNTVALDLRKMLLPEKQESTNEMWSQLSQAVARLPQLKRIDLGRCSPQAIETVVSACPQLESVVSLSVRGTEINLSSICQCTNLTELRLKSIGGLEMKNLEALKSLSNLKTLALTTMKNLEGIDGVLSPSLENLEIGDCIHLPESLASETFPKLVNLKRLRLEKGQSSTCPTIMLLNAIANLPNLTQLELINFDIKPGFEKALACCSNIKVLLIIPTYVTQSATTNHVVMGGVSKLSGTLQYFIWGLTLELLKVTDLFINQVEGHHKGKTAPKKSGSGDSIPILKPLNEEGGESKEGQSASQVDILGLPKLQRVLSTLLPQTKIKILKVPFSATWRQTVTDGPYQ